MPARSELFVIALFCIIPIALTIVLVAARPHASRTNMEDQDDQSSGR